MSLQKWLEDRDETIYQFSRRSYVSEYTLKKVIAGEPVFCSTAKRIMRHAPGLEKDDFKIISRKFNDVDEKSPIA